MRSRSRRSTSQAPGKPRYRGLLAADARASGRPGEPWTAELRAEIRDAALLYKSASGADRTVELGLTHLTLLSEAERHRLDLRVSDAADIDFTVALEAARIAGEVDWRTAGQRHRARARHA